MIKTKIKGYEIEFETVKELKEFLKDEPENTRIEELQNPADRHFLASRIEHDDEVEQFRERITQASKSGKVKRATPEEVNKLITKIKKLMQEGMAFSTAFVKANGYTSGGKMAKVKKLLNITINKRHKTKPTLSQLDKQPQCPTCFSTRLTIKKQTKNGTKTKFMCKNCAKEFTAINTTPQQAQRRKHRNTWPDNKRQKYLKDFKKMTPEELRKKYGIKGQSTVYALAADFMKRQNKHAEKTNPIKPTNPNMKLRQEALKSLRGNTR